MALLAENAGEYGRRRLRRPAADPIGMRGLPASRAGLDAMLRSLCDRLTACGPAGLRGRQIAHELGLESTRALRLLIAYGRVQHHLHQLVGLPGDGYCWGDSRAGIYAVTIADNERRARCHFFIAALHRRQGVAMAAVQMLFDFMGHQVAPERRRNDDLAAMIAAEGVSVADFLDAFVGSLAQTEDGRSALRRVGEKHGDVLMPEGVLADALAKIDEARVMLSASSHRS